MSNDDIAAAVLECVGGFSNVAGNALCATRLRITLKDRALANRNALHSINGVLGIAERGESGLEVVFGPNLVRGVYRSFERLTGLFSEGHPGGKVTRRPTANFQVKITPETPGAPQVQSASPRQIQPEIPALMDDDTSALLEMLDEEPTDTQNEADAPQAITDETVSTPQEQRPALLVINGPNVNMLGMSAFGNASTPDYAALLALCHEHAQQAGFASCECYQSNHEGDLIDRLQDAWDGIDAIVINAGGYAYTSVALLDAVAQIGAPAIEVQLERAIEGDGLPWQSFVGRACLKTISGHGIEGYAMAIFDLAHQLGLR